jgi:hypothetical protein
MPKIKINNFSGISPETPPRYLADGQAQTALNCANWYGPLAPLKDVFGDGGSYFAADYVDPTYSQLTDNNLLPGFAANTIYLFGAQIGIPKWFHWAEDVDVATGFIFGDLTERTFFTGTGKPQSTDLSMNNGGGPYPESSYDLGLPIPTNPPICNVTGTATAGAIPETRVYTYTWVNSWGDESAPYSFEPMPASAFANVSNGQSVVVTLPVVTTGNFNILYKRIYRLVSGSAGNGEYLFVAQVGAAINSYIDAVTAENLGEACPSLTWAPPPNDLKGLIGLSNGILAGFVGRDLYLCDPYHPYAFPLEYVQTVRNKIVCLSALDTTICALTEGRPVFIQGSHPDSMVMVDADIDQACVSKRSVVRIGGYVYYASPDGLVRLSTSGSDIVTKQLLTKEQWQEMIPTSIHAYKDERRYIGFFQSTVYGNGGFILDLEKNVFVIHNVYVEAGYNSLEFDRFYVAQSNYIMDWEGGAALSYTWKSKVFTYPMASGFAAYRVDTEGTGVTLKVYRDGVEILNKAVTSRQAGRLPAGKGKDWEFLLTGTDEVFQLAVAGSMRDIGNG